MRKRSPIWVLEATVSKIHDAQIAEHGGKAGLRDRGLLQSALHHPQNLYNYGNCTLFELAAAYAERIAKNHPFFDGNKRTAFVSMVLFLKLNGFDLVAPKEDKVKAMVQLASNQMSLEAFTQWIAASSKH